MNRRKIDSRGEKALGIFLDTYFYKKAQELRIIKYANRIYEKESQKKGIDIILNNTSNVDEKAQLYYINNPVDSFVFEIDYYNEKKQNISDGWFISSVNETDAYLLIWIRKAKTTHINRLVAEDFEIIEANLIKKDKIKNYIQKWGITDEVIKKKAIEMRAHEIERFVINDECHITYSFKKGDYSEKPINLVLRKNRLDALSEYRFLITKESVEIL